MATEAIIIGGGLAGTSAAYALAERGYQVILIERHGALAAEGSGNKAGVLKPIIGAAKDIVSQFSFAAFQYAITYYQALASVVPQLSYNLCGVLQLTKALRGKQVPPDVSHLSSDIAYSVNAQEASALSGLTLHHDGVFLPGGGWVSPSGVCAAYSKAAGNNITVFYHKEAITLERQSHIWQVKEKNGAIIASAPIIVIANAYDSKQLAQTAFLKLRSIRGQVTFLPATTYSRGLKTVVSHTGTLLPAIEGQHVVGSSFIVDDTDSRVRPEENAHNIDVLGHYMPELIAGVDATSLSGWAAIRASVPDRMPIVGAVPGDAGLYVSTGYGSRGLTHIPFATSLLVKQVMGESTKEYEGFIRRLTPERFVG